MVLTPRGCCPFDSLGERERVRQRGESVTLPQRERLVISSEGVVVVIA